MSTENRFCPKCGKSLPAGATFCPSCGEPVSSLTAPLSGFDTVIKDSVAQTYWVRRVVAFAIDAVIVYLILGVLAVILAIPSLLLSGPAAFGSVLAGIFGFVSGLILVLYFTLAETLTGATFGKGVMGLKVLATGGKFPTAGQAILRNISKVFWLLLLLDVIVGLATSKKYSQKYSDTFAGTEVL